MRATEKQIKKFKKMSKSELTNTSNHMRNYYAYNPYIGWMFVHVGFKSDNHFQTILDCLKLKESDISEIRLDTRKMK